VANKSERKHRGRMVWRKNKVVVMEDWTLPRANPIRKGKVVGGVCLKDEE